ncbi:hypothetical protein [Agromyces bauzanensis]|uniref:Uncharacterized protein n=1 Tax=Agromyces bauzanensis TaxID=1308924 RepID=A0A917UU80_9MICO|nr:hypothetical protein [Agromyces bauzanensis]GGJ85480.1 hypothetical protein GCM10011372_24720 [Agromyces bauzanensis]
MGSGSGTEHLANGSERVAIERWWPHLSIESKHRLLAALDAAIDEKTAAEIESVTGAGAPARLSGAEQQFVRTQVEPVD